MRPAISIVMPVRNGMPLLAESLQSIALQRYRPLELIVADDGSTDGTAEEVRRFAREFPARRIALPEGGCGPAAARNAGIRASQADRIAFLDADDLWSPDAIPLLARALDEYPEAGIVRGMVRNFRESPGGSREFFTAPYRCLQVGACLWRKSLFETVGLFDEDLRIGEDYDFLLRCWENDVLKVEIDPVVLHYRRHPSSLTHGLTGPGFGAVPVFAKRIQRIRAGIHDPARRRHIDQAEYLALGGGPAGPDRAFPGNPNRK